jgi:LacI family transcriptional regulator, galactose operon repressor
MVPRKAEDIKKFKMKELAQQAGVSVATAYRVVKQTAQVSPEREARVLKLARDLGIPIRQTSPSKVISFLLGNRPTLHAFHSQVLVGAAARCAESDFGIHFFPMYYPVSLSPKELPMPRNLQGKNAVDGFIAAGTNSQNLLDRLAETRRPFAILGNNVVGEWRRDQCDVVWMDLTETSFQVTKYLQSLGHSRIWFLQNSRLPWMVHCFEGYARAMQENGLEPRSRDFFSEDEREAGYLAMKSLLGQGEAVTAVFAASDYVALGVYDVIREKGLRIPEDVSVVGVGDRAEVAGLYPALSTLRGFPEQVGRHLAELVLSRIEQPDRIPQRVVIPSQFIKRDSCGPMRAVFQQERRERIPIAEPETVP